MREILRRDAGRPARLLGRLLRNDLLRRNTCGGYGNVPVSYAFLDSGLSAFGQLKKPGARFRTGLTDPNQLSANLDPFIGRLTRRRKLEAESRHPLAGDLKRGLQQQSGLADIQNKAAVHPVKEYDVAYVVYFSPRVLAAFGCCR